MCINILSYSLRSARHTSQSSLCNKSDFGDALGKFLNAKYADRVETGITARQMVFTVELYAALLVKDPSLKGKSTKEQKSMLVLLVWG